MNNSRKNTQHLQVVIHVHNLLFIHLHYDTSYRLFDKSLALHLLRYKTVQNFNEKCF